MRSFTLSIAGVIIGAIIVGAFALTYFANANGQFTLPAFQSSVATSTDVGPDTSVQILATTSKRMYAYIARNLGSVPVYCSFSPTPTDTANNVSFMLSTTTSNFYEIDIEKNAYTGPISCTASATTTLIVSELLIR